MSLHGEAVLDAAFERGSGKASAPTANDTSGDSTSARGVNNVNVPRPGLLATARTAPCDSSGSIDLT